GGGGLRLLLEPAEALRVLRKRRRQHLDRHLAPEARIARAIHLAHPTGAEGRQDLVGAEARAGGERHFGPTRAASAANRGSARRPSKWGSKSINVIQCDRSSRASSRRAKARCVSPSAR